MRNIRGQLHILWTLLLLAGIGIVTSGCESGTEGSASLYSVQYIVAGEYLLGGSADLTTVWYDDGSDTTQMLEFDPPEEGWSNTLILEPGDTVYLRAEGTVANGRLSIQIAIEGDDGSLNVLTNNNMPFTDGEVWVEIPQEALP